ncbi:Wzz/FepE/Etk N-terminal domain-containing protein [Mesobacillus maritimus]|uniref:YveK family protein n=1 Tax=Mesobacillus maritimus TaxID=1643336 RepID=UPI0020406095|nr:Wzz/FepE/Etk N-terminal domain-containing protein [Mesobacillus maritimus]MCM3670888.1 Wzz/FepE/Etk N-terminal domain-containing protein [Mesobacillus maritimus]
MEETISLKELLQTLRKRLALIIAIALTATIISGVVSFFLLTPIYQASTQILVNQSKDEQSLYNYNEVQTNLQLINTYNVIIKSPRILDIVAEELKLGLSSQQLNGKITVGNESDSQVVNISVQDENPKVAADIANTVATVFSKEIESIMNVDNVSILSKAEVVDGQSPVKPQPIMNIAIALVVGLMAGVGLAFLLEYFDNTVKNEQDVEKGLELPILGVVSVIDEAKMEEASARRAARKTNARGETIGS